MRGFPRTMQRKLVVPFVCILTLTLGAPTLDDLVKQLHSTNRAIEIVTQVVEVARSRPLHLVRTVADTGATLRRLCVPAPSQLLGRRYCCPATALLNWTEPLVIEPPGTEAGWTLRVGSCLAGAVGENAPGLAFWTAAADPVGVAMVGIGWSSTVADFDDLWLPENSEALRDYATQLRQATADLDVPDVTDLGASVRSLQAFARSAVADVTISTASWSASKERILNLLMAFFVIVGGVAVFLAPLPQTQQQSDDQRGAAGVRDLIFGLMLLPVTAMEILRGLAKRQGLEAWRRPLRFWTLRQRLSPKLSPCEESIGRWEHSSWFWVSTDLTTATVRWPAAVGFIVAANLTVAPDLWRVMMHVEVGIVDVMGVFQNYWSLVSFGFLMAIKLYIVLLGLSAVRRPSVMAVSALGICTILALMMIYGGPQFLTRANVRISYAALVIALLCYLRLHFATRTHGCLAGSDHLSEVEAESEVYVRALLQGSTNAVAFPPAAPEHSREAVPVDDDTPARISPDKRGVPDMSGVPLLCSPEARKKAYEAEARNLPARPVFRSSMLIASILPALLWVVPASIEHQLDRAAGLDLLTRAILSPVEDAKREIHYWQWFAGLEEADAELLAQLGDARQGGTASLLWDVDPEGSDIARLLANVSHFCGPLGESAADACEDALEAIVLGVADRQAEAREAAEWWCAEETEEPTILVRETLCSQAPELSARLCDAVLPTGGWSATAQLMQMLLRSDRDLTEAHRLCSIRVPGAVRSSAGWLWRRFGVAGTSRLARLSAVSEDPIKMLSAIVVHQFSGYLPSVQASPMFAAGVEAIARHVVELVTNLEEAEETINSIRRATIPLIVMAGIFAELGALGFVFFLLSRIATSYHEVYHMLAKGASSSDKPRRNIFEASIFPGYVFSTMILAYYLAVGLIAGIMLAASLLTIPPVRQFAWTKIRSVAGPSLMLILSKVVFQQLVMNRLLYQDGEMKHPVAFNILFPAQVIVDLLYGAMAGVTRVVMAALVSFVRAFRVDTPAWHNDLMPDGGHEAFVCMVAVAHREYNPVKRMALRCIAGSHLHTAWCWRSGNGNGEEEDAEQQRRPSKTRARVHARWALALTLARNPSLQKDRVYDAPPSPSLVAEAMTAADERRRSSQFPSHCGKEAGEGNALAAAAAVAVDQSEAAIELVPQIGSRPELAETRP